MTKSEALLYCYNSITVDKNAQLKSLLNALHEELSQIVNIGNMFAADNLHDAIKILEDRDNELNYVSIHKVEQLLLECDYDEDNTTSVWEDFDTFRITFITYNVVRRQCIEEGLIDENV